MSFSKIPYTRQKQHLHAPQPSPLKAALMAASKLKAEMPKESVISIIWDSSASLSITNDKTDFDTIPTGNG